MSWLHNYLPTNILLNIGPINIHWYGFLIVLAILICLSLILRLSAREDREHFWNLTFYLLIFGILGARLVHVFFYNFSYFVKNPLAILKVWEGGLAIPGAVLAGLITILIYCFKQRLAFWRFSDLIALALPLGQAIGRWGNYFNQELFGRPCNGNWCIPIKKINRPLEYQSVQYFQPLFLYESALNLLLFALLILFYRIKKPSTGAVTLAYLIGYSTIRFIMEFLRLDSTFYVFGLKTVQWLCLLIIIISIIFLFRLAKLSRK